MDNAVVGLRRIENSAQNVARQWLRELKAKTFYRKPHAKVAAEKLVIIKDFAPIAVRQQDKGYADEMS